MAADRRAQERAERTEEERERAREERERRRREREPAAVPLPPPAFEQPPPRTETAAQSDRAARPVDPIATVLPTVAQTDTRAQARVSHPDDPRHFGRGSIVASPQLGGTSRSSGRRAAFLFLVAVLLVLVGGAAVLLIHRADRKAPPAPAPLRIVRVLIPEGYTASQMQALAREDGLRGDYLAAVRAARHRGELRPSTYGAPRATRSLEGFLFPATYELYEHTPAARLVSDQLAAFRANFGGGETDRARKLHMTPYQLLTIASIVEREAASAHDRPLVAAVIYNRLHASMTLGVDATLRYALHDFSHPLTEAQLATNTPYNTRLHPGLPPTPISNPGAAAIAAAAHPAHASYLYYVNGADGCGDLVFSSSYAQFERDAAAYREALARNGGNVPKCRRK
ncbi:MAG TPA: endolytic transglycosylase MltG [Solirubrobacteraceae bacterium]|nr:endolytic transglycosylase MltG [Solirubrobacteraceae bacterium]